jgi:hypothetical protein
MSQIYTNLLYCIAYAPHFGLFASHLAIYRPANGPQDQAMVPRQHGTEEPVHGVAAADCTVQVWEEEDTQKLLRPGRRLLWLLGGFCCADGPMGRWFTEFGGYLHT